MTGLRLNGTSLAILASFAISGCGYTRLANGAGPTSVPYYPTDLAIIYFAEDAEFNSFDGYIEKNIGTRLVKTPFILSSSEKARIYAVLKDMDLASYGGSLRSRGYGARSLHVRCGNVQTTLSWSNGNAGSDEASMRLRNLQQVLDDVLFNNGYFLTLPPYEGPARR